jgi:hypothetical protein
MIGFSASDVADFVLNRSFSGPFTGVLIGMAVSFWFGLLGQNHGL